MSGDTTTMSGDTTTRTIAQPTLAQSRAARELHLKRGEFDLAVWLGRIRTVPDDGCGARRVTRAEIDRVRSEKGFPEALRERVKAVGTSEAAALMGISTGRFTRFARLGLVVPVKWYLNRYRAVVWLYLAEELRQFAANKKNEALLNNRIPTGLRDQLNEGLDLRARNWRGRHLGFSLRQTQDPWARAAAVASLLDPVQVAEVVADPCERAYLDRYRSDRYAPGAPDSPAAHVTARIRTATDPDEISWLRADLANGLEEARGHRPAPRPETEPGARHMSPLCPVPPGEHRVTAENRPTAGGPAEHVPPVHHPPEDRPTEERPGADQSVDDRPGMDRCLAELRRAAMLRHPAGRGRAAETRRPDDVGHPAGRRRSAPAGHAAEQRRAAAQGRRADVLHLSDARQQTEARHTIEKPEPPRGLLRRLRRGNP